VRAIQMLLMASLFWGISFPVMKGIEMVYRDLALAPNSWFASSSTVLIRFGIAAFIMLAWSWRSFRLISRAEVTQGLGLGIFGGTGILLQMDGLAYTSASTSAFLTQCYCVLLPWLSAIRDRQAPGSRILFCSGMVIAGVAVLAGLDVRHLHLGRGESETLLGSLMFTGQILWLERPRFSGNRVRHFSLVMFATMALVALPVALATARGARDWMTVFTSPAILSLTAVLVVFCTLAAFLLMNRWQPSLPAAEAGLIYTTEPLFASALALFLPAYLSACLHVHYQNEQLTASLLFGGGLITAANFLILVPRLSRARPSVRASDPLLVANRRAATALKQPLDPASGE
jgi:drug/metabolite transporter (DMT)-like permease